MTTTSESQARQRLSAVGQEHVLHHWGSLLSSQRDALLAQIAEIDVAGLPALIDGYVKHKPTFELPAGVAPAKYYPHDAKAGRAWDKAAAQKAGEDLIRRGKVAAFVVAGGQGSRLGFEGPKGCYPAGAVTDKPLFQIFAENLLGARDRYGVRVPWYVMTSPLNHAATVAFFEQHKFFGLDKADVMFFPQGVMPSLDIKTGKMLLSAKHEIATNPDGHGGAIKALHVSGALSDMQKRGVEHLSYFQVDNPSVRIVDPVFLGLHVSAADSSREMSSKMVAKANAEEKVGLFCSVSNSSAGMHGSKTVVIEYSDLPMELQRQTHADGSLKFNAGSIAIHVIAVEFIQRLATDPKFALPFHRAEKKIACVDPVSGVEVKPSENNGVKLERFVFDALDMCGVRSGSQSGGGSIVLETDRVEEFAPIKNATGADSVVTSKQLQTLRAARWLEACGVAIPKGADGSPECVIEISPRTATCAEELKGVKLPRAVERGQRLVL